MSPNKKKELFKKGAWILLLLLLMTLIYSIAPVVVSGESMAPTIYNGQTILMERLTLLFEQKLQHGDIIVIRLSAESNSKIIKRVIGMPGDIIEIQNNAVYINNERIDETYVTEAMNTDNLGPIVLSDDEYFVCEDNRNFSLDSRSDQVGMISSQNILGKAIIF